MFCLSKGKPKTFNPIMVKSVHGGEDMNWGGRKTVMDNAQCRRHRSEDIWKVKDTKQHDNIFDYTIGGEKTGHPAVFPQMLVRDQIISWSNEGDIVLDPFMGSGTTAEVARYLGRHYIGFEIAAEYCEIIKQRLSQQVLF
jgi:site-specific DNA-methyltransferase (adenine-specific)